MGLMTAMKKITYFDELWGAEWPTIEWLSNYFLLPAVRQRYFDLKGRGGRFTLEGVESTEHLQRNKGRVDIDLFISGQQDLGVLLYYRKSGDGLNEAFFSRGDLTKRKTWFYDRYGTAHSHGLFIPFESAWIAVKEFLVTEGALPRSIEWVAQHDLPPDTLPNR